jgi:hypothetical protein
MDNPRLFPLSPGHHGPFSGLLIFRLADRGTFAVHFLQQQIIAVCRE